MKFSDMANVDASTFYDFPRYYSHSNRSISHNYGTDDEYNAAVPLPIRFNHFTAGDIPPIYNSQPIERPVIPIVNRAAGNGGDDLPRYFPPAGGRSMENRGYDETEFRRMIADEAMTENGSIALQNCMAKCNCVCCTNILFHIVLDHFLSFVTNEFANHTFSRLVERCNERQLRVIVHELTKDTRVFISILHQKYGPNSVKRLIKMLKGSPLVNQITRMIVRSIVPLMNTRISSHVVTTCLECFDANQNMLFIEIILNCIQIASDERGSVALNDCIEYFQQPYKAELLREISNNAMYLIQHSTGKYVVKKVLSLGNEQQVIRIICEKLHGNFVRFSTVKGWSHVVEQCLRSRIGADFVLHDFLNNGILWTIARHEYGNYVLQTALRFAQGSELYREFVFRLYKDRNYFQSGHGRNVYRMIMELFGMISRVLPANIDHHSL